MTDFFQILQSGDDQEKLHNFLNLQWRYQMQEFPEQATFVGYPDQNDRWTDWSLTALERRHLERKSQLEVLRQLNRTQLNHADQLSLDLAIYQLEMAIEAYSFGADYMPVNHMDNLFTNLIDQMACMPKNTLKDYRCLIQRLFRFPVLAQQTELLMREGLKRGIMPAHHCMAKISQQIEELLIEPVENGPLFESLRDITLDPNEKDEILRKAKEGLQSYVYPAMKNFRSFFEKDYAPHGRKKMAWSSLPQGESWYSYSVRQQTTTNLTPEEIHQMGLAEVARISRDMDEIRERVKFSGDRAAFRNYLLSETKFHLPSAEALLTGYRELIKKIDPELPKFFKTLPKLKCEVRAMPEFRAKTGPGGLYFGGSLETGRPGFFEANTFDLPSRPSWDMETLTLHETIPGHHFQISIAQETKNLPETRKHSFYTAYAEGWALYAESLGKDLGLFQDPYSEFGHLSAEMLRAVRLVVDTGMHALGWSREHALQYFRDHVATTDLDSENEIDRYIALPAQALAYKVGELKIQSLRRKAHAELGSKFDLREFHDQILNYGSLPLMVLENIVDNWIESSKTQTGH